MAHRYEYVETDADVAGIGSVSNAVLPGPLSGMVAYKCTIFDEETGEEVASGCGWSKGEARDQADSNL